MMILLIAWRNVWRNKLRSIVVMLSIILGVWAGVFLMAFTYGMNNERTRTMLRNTISHLQIHHPQYIEDREVQYFIQDTSDLQSAIEENTKISGVSWRVILTGMISSATTSHAISLSGINPMDENKVTMLESKIIDGQYFNESKNKIIIGQSLAEKLKVKLNSKVVVTFQDSQNEMVSTSLKIIGIYKSGSSQFDEYQTYIKVSEAQALLGISNQFHEIAIWLNDISLAEEVKKEIQKRTPSNEVQTWSELAPTLAYADDMIGSKMYIFIVIILFALAFGVLNTMLMAVLERKRELGMLLSVGMNKTKVFLMIMLETIFLSAVAGPLGILFGWLFNQYYHNRGLDLSTFAEGLENYGMGTMIYPELAPEFYLNIAIMVLITAILSAIYPGIKALKLNPAEAVRAF